MFNPVSLLVFCHICLKDNPVKRHLGLNLCRDCYDKVINKNGS